MLSLGFQMLSVFPWMKKARIRMPKVITNKVHALSESDSKFAPFALGAATFFLPCGFTQALQFYVLSRGEPLEGALIMFVFSLGTLPALISLGALTSFVKGGAKRFVFRTAGVIVIVLGLLSLKSGLALTGVAGTFDRFVTGIVAEKPSGDAAPVQGGKQVVDMRVEGYEYFPSEFTVKAGIPVEWRVDGRNAAGCAQIITIPGMRLTKRLSKAGVTTITFTPQQEGRLDFSCTMGMTTPGAHFAVLPATKNFIPQDDPVIGSTDYSKCDPSRAMCL
jgi:plastocyanin